MRLVAFDSETHVIQPGLQVPPLVLGSYDDGSRAGLLWPAREAVDYLIALLRDDATTIVGANVFYDLAVAHQHALDQRGEDLMPAIFGALRADRIYDVQLAEQLHAIARGHLGYRCDAPHVRLPGRYSLDVVLAEVTGDESAKACDTYRMRYHEFENTPPEDMPTEARVYPVDDARNTRRAALGQLGLAPRRGRHAWGRDGSCQRCGTRGESAECLALEVAGNIHDLGAQARAAWALTLFGAHGLARDPEAVLMLRRAWENSHAQGQDRPFLEAGILRPDGTEDQGALKRRLVLAYAGDSLPEVCPTCATPQHMPPLRRKPRPPEARSGRVRNAHNTDWILCPDCEGTGLVIGAGVPRAPKGGVSCARDALFESGDELLVEYGEYGEGGKTPTTILPWLERGLADGLPLTVRYNTLLVTNRVSVDGPAQTLTRTPGMWIDDGAVRYYHPSPREAFVARPGHVLCSTDYESGEMVAWAQVCYSLLGASTLGEALNRGIKPHSVLAARVMGISYEEFEARRKAGDKHALAVRQVCKIFNFGCAGGMGSIMLLLQARSNRDADTPCPDGPVWISDGKGGRERGYRGIRFCIMLRGRPRCGARKITEWRGRPCPPVCLECAELSDDIRGAWAAQWSESEAYFARASRDADAGIVEHTTGFVRGGHGFCATANGHFQELLARWSKEALFDLARAMYDESAGSILYGARGALFMHDEPITEHWMSHAAEEAEEVSRIMVAAQRRWCPDVSAACAAEPALMRRWDKRATTVRDDRGRLQVWEPPGESPWRNENAVAPVL